MTERDDVPHDRQVRSGGAPGVGAGSGPARPGYGVILAALLALALLVLSQAGQPLLPPVVSMLVAALGLICLGLLWHRLRSADQRVVTERRRAHADHDRLSVALGRERATLATVIASMGEGLAILDADRIVRFVNRPAALVLGLQPGSALGMHVEEVIGQLTGRLEAPAEAFADWRRVSTNPDTRETFEVRMRSAEPSEPIRDIRVQVFPVPTDDDARAGVGLTLRDVTTERQVDRVKDEFISVVNHELRTPLASVVGFAELLLAREFPDEQRRRFLTSMVQEGRRLASLVDDLLDLQRLTGGSDPFTFEPCIPRALLERAIAAAGPDPDRPISLDAPIDLPPVRADANRIQQVLSNLLGNARKYSPAGGEIILSATVIDGAVEIAVTDHGLGIPSDALPRLFERFYRVDNSDRREIRGTGLGLAIAKSIVEAHGGEMKAASPGLGQGARLSFTLPQADAPAEIGDVLIVEDDLVFGRLLEVELGARGLTARRVESGAAALAAVLGQPPRAVMLDLVLPDTTGADLLRDVRARGTTIGTVIVVTHRDLLAAERAELEGLGATSVLLKRPGIASIAAEAVAQALGGLAPVDALPHPGGQDTTGIAP